VFALEVFVEADGGEFVFELGEVQADFADALGVTFGELRVELSQVVQAELRAIYSVLRMSSLSTCLLIKLKDLSSLSFLLTSHYFRSLKVSILFRWRSRKFLKLRSS